MDSKLNAPKKITWIVGVVIAVIVLISLLFTIPFFTAFSPWLALIGLVLMLVATYISNL